LHFFAGQWLTEALREGAANRLWILSAIELR
jgi:hypothetical protein